MARKSHDDGGGGQEWMNTYSDLVTLLMTFFVLLFSMSSVDAEKWENFVKALANPGDDTSQIVINAPEEGGDSPLTNQGDANQLTEGTSPSDEMSPLPTDFDDLYAFLQKFVDENNLGSAIEVSKSGDNVVYIRFRNNIFFMPDESYLKEDGLEVLSYLGDCLGAVQDQIKMISINGHTAQTDDPDYSVSDWMLSGERSSRVADYLDNEKKIDPTKLRPMGYGKNFPIADNATKEGREQNRRVDITIVRDDGNANIESQLADLFDPAQFPKSGGAEDLFSAAPEDGVTSTAGADELPPPASDDAAPDTPGGEVIPPPESSDGTVIPPPESTSGTVIPPPDTTGGTSTAPIAGTQDQ